MHARGELGRLTAANVHTLIDLVDEQPDLRQRLEELDADSLRKELRQRAREFTQKPAGR